MSLTIQHRMPLKFFPFIKCYINFDFILGSGRSDECIDFTTMCGFYFFLKSVYTISIRNNALISDFFGRKVNLVGAL